MQISVFHWFLVYLYALNITRYVWIAVDYISAAGTCYRYAAPETGILAFEDCHTSGCMAG